MRAAAVCRGMPLAAALVVALGCGGTLDAGHERSHTKLPVDDRNPIIIDQDDWSVDWLGEHAVLLASSGAISLKGIIVNATPFWPNLDANASGWRDLVTAAESSGLKNIPTVTPSDGPPLTRPANSQIDATPPNRSAGAELILKLSNDLSQPSRPLVVVSATSLTDLADAYLIDHTVTQRVVVVAALGVYRDPNGIMAVPNGDMDPWADWIVSQRYRFIQVGTWYDQTGDVTMAQVATLPMNALGAFMTRKRSKILPDLTASDQVALLSVALPTFVGEVKSVSPDVAAGFDEAQGPNLVPDEKGDDLVVTQIAGPLAASKLWQLLLDPHTFTP